MIFVTVGSQMPFRRLVRAVDEWAQRNPGIDVLAQVGTGESYRPQALRSVESVPPDRYDQLVRDCDLLVAHAGMGSVLTALEHGKPMLLMPRRGALQETRNDHQLATLRWLQGKPGIHGALDETALQRMLDGWRARGLAAPPREGTGSWPLDSLVATLRGFIG